MSKIWVNGPDLKENAEKKERKGSKCTRVQTLSTC